MSVLFCFRLVPKLALLCWWSREIALLSCPSTLLSSYRRVWGLDGRCNMRQGSGWWL